MGAVEKSWNVYMFDVGMRMGGISYEENGGLAGRGEHVEKMRK